MKNDEEKHQIYWGKRLADKLYDRHTDKMTAELKKIYRQQAHDIRAKIVELYSDMLEDGEISTTKLYEYGRYNQLLEEINKITGETCDEQIKLMQDELEKVYRETFQQTSSALGKDISWGLANADAMTEVVNANFKGANFSTRVWAQNRDKMTQVIGKELQNIVGSGQNKDKAVTKIMQLCKASFSNADRLVRTETMRVINSGQINSFKENGYTHGYYIVSDDDRLCEYCRAIAQETKANPVLLEDMESIHHPRCRCTIIPVVPKISILEMARKTGELPYQKNFDYNAAKGLSMELNNSQDSDKIKATGENIFKNGFTEKALKRHIEKHLNEYDKMTPKEYNDYALNLIQQAVSDDIYGYKTSEGTIVRYRKSTNDFVKGYPDTGIATMFKPKGNNKKGYKYYKEQEEKEGLDND
ncbi:MAG: minor capsid protein [Clostridia bacterium]|nr:minor capsid protein [Clostridia bacterium]